MKANLPTDVALLCGGGGGTPTSLNVMLRQTTARDNVETQYKYNIARRSTLKKLKAEIWGQKKTNTFSNVSVQDLKIKKVVCFFEKNTKTTSPYCTFLQPGAQTSSLTDGEGEVSCGWTWTDT